MEKDNAQKTMGGVDAQNAKEGTSFSECCQSCCGSKDVPREMGNKWKDCCKGMPDLEEMNKMMKMCFPGGKKKE